MVRMVTKLSPDGSEAGVLYNFPYLIDPHRSSVIAKG